jgi:flagellar biosynthesis/type III secretory pathway protein FliH
MSVAKKTVLCSYIVIAVIIFIIITAKDHAYNTAYNTGYDKGYSTGKDSGYNVGNDVGYKRAKSEDKIVIDRLQTKASSITTDYENKMSSLRRDYESKLSSLSNDYENKIVQARKEEFLNGQTQMRNRIESQINTNVKNNIAKKDWNAPVASIKK